MGGCSSKPATEAGAGAEAEQSKSVVEVSPAHREQLIAIHSKAQLGAKKAPEPRTVSIIMPDGVEKVLEQGAHRLKNIFAAPIQFGENFVAPEHKKNEEDYKFIRKALSGNFVFSSLSDEEMKIFILAMESHEVAQDSKIIVQGDIGDYFYIIHSGTVRFEVGDKNVGSATTGGSFGELALLYNAPRAATCVAEEPCSLWRVDQDTFRKILAHNTMKNDKEIRGMLSKVKFLAENLEERHLNRLTAALTPVSFRKGEELVRKGDKGDVFYILKEGEVKVTDISVGESKYEDQTLGPGDHFGERAIVKEEPRVANVVATSDGVALCLSGDQFKKILGPLSALIMRSQDKQRLLGVPLIADLQLTPEEADTMTGLFNDVSYSKGFTLANVDENIIAGIYIVRDGKISITPKTGKVVEIVGGGFFGDDTLQPKDGKLTSMVVSQYTVTVLEDCTLSLLSLKSISSVVNPSRLGKKAPAVRDTLDRSIQMKDLKKHKILGAGTFGQVWLVSNKKSHETRVFALKIQTKDELIKHNQVDGVMRERNVMAMIDHPFIINLVNTYQDDSNLFMLLDLVPGGELFSVIHGTRRDSLSEPQAKFYAAGMLEALSYLHNRHILYRDLKPENILIDKGGYTVMVDLGFAKIVMDKTFTLCGTPLYLAPEVILSRGHDKGADYWSWGVLLYEMVHGLTPFYEKGMDQMALFKAIVRGKYQFPIGMMISDPLKDLIGRVLVTASSNRLGNLASGAQDIKDHEWFEDMDFEKLIKKEISAPWKPKLRNAFDISNFDSWDHLDDKTTMPGRRLTEAEQKQFAGF